MRKQALAFLLLSFLLLVLIFSFSTDFKDDSYDRFIRLTLYRGQPTEIYSISDAILYNVCCKQKECYFLFGDNISQQQISYHKITKTSIPRKWEFVVNFEKCEIYDFFWTIYLLAYDALNNAECGKESVFGKYSLDKDSRSYLKDFTCYDFDNLNSISERSRLFKKIILKQTEKPFFCEDMPIISGSEALTKSDIFRSTPYKLKEMLFKDMHTRSHYNSYNLISKTKP